MMSHSPALPAREKLSPAPMPAEVRENSLAQAARALGGVNRQALAIADLPNSVLSFVDRLAELRLVERGLLDAFLRERSERLAEYDTEDRVGRALVHAGLLTAYQLERVLCGATAGLVFGNYRVLEGLGSGGMGVVYLAEHRLMRRRVAVKVLPVDEDCPVAVRQRFYGELRLLADLNHPNIVLAFDAGELDSAGPDAPGQIYLVMEVVDGGDLERLVVKNGPCDVARACDFVRQAAAGLQAAHDRHLVHRDIKPSNLLLTTAGQVKLVDFGLARQFSSRLTDPRVLLGSVEFMAPEQSHDPSAVGKEADIYGLGATLFWLLTGEAPYEFMPSVSAALRALQREPPRRLRDVRSGVPAELDELVARMLDRNPDKRPAMPAAVAHELTPFLLGSGRFPAVTASDSGLARRGKGGTRRVLLVDVEAQARRASRRALEDVDCVCVEAADEAGALLEMETRPIDLVVLDEGTCAADQAGVYRRFRDRSVSHNLKVIVRSTRDGALSLRLGADDHLPHSAPDTDLAAKIVHLLNLKDSQDRANAMLEQVLAANRQLRQSLDSRGADVYEAHNAILFAMAKMAESRDGETPGHLRRLQGYTRVLAVESAKLPLWAGLVDDRFLAQLERCVPLHDIGKIGLPDDILLKPASLSTAERLLVETHPLIGDRILDALGQEHGAALDFLGMARGIVRHHHERFNGRGYPDRLQGDEIPAAARLTAVADVYDALRRERLHKSAMSHAEAVQVILRRSDGQFDPVLLMALEECHEQIEQIYREIGD